MADLIVSSTTDNPEQMQAALDHKPSEPVTRGSMVAAVTPPPNAADAVPSVTETPPAAGEPAAPPVEGAPAASEGTPAAAAAAPEGGTPAAPAAPVMESPEEVAQMGRRAQRRIHRLTAEREVERQRADRAEAELQRLRAGGVPAGTPGAPPPVAAPAPRTVEPAAIDTAAIRAAALAAVGAEPVADDFETHEEFLKALSAHAAKVAAREVVETRFAEQQAENEARAALERERQIAAANEEALDRFTESRAKAVQRYPDFETVMAAAKDLPMSPVMEGFVVGSPVGNDIAYYFATHPDEARDIAAIADPAVAQYEMSKLEGYVERLAKSAGAPPAAAAAAPGAPPASAAAAAAVPAGGTSVGSSAPAPVVSSLPAPITPVAGRGTGPAVSLDEMPYDQFKARRNAEEAARRAARM